MGTCCGSSSTTLQLVFIPLSELKLLEKTRHFPSMIHWILAMHLPRVWRHESHLQYVWQLKFGCWPWRWETRKRLDGTSLPDGKCSARTRVEWLGTEPDTSAFPEDLLGFHTQFSSAPRSPQTRLAWPNQTLWATHFSFFRQIISSSTEKIPTSLPAWVFVSPQIL